MNFMPGRWREKIETCSVFFGVFKSVFKNCGKGLKHKKTLHKMATFVNREYMSSL